MEPTQKLIYDRSFKDVQRVAELNRKISAGSTSAEEVQEWFSAKGALNYEDLNRIESWTEFLSNQLKSYGYNAPITKRAEQTYTYYEKPEPGDEPSEPVARLPEGYRELTYIESTGTQYVDTGFKPNGNTRVVCDFQITRAHDGTRALFGARDNTTNYLYAFWHIATNAFRTDYYGKYENMTVSDELARTVVDKNKNVTIIGDTSLTYTATDAQTPYNLYLFAVNKTGTVTSYSYVRIYSCQIYDNGTLVRDYIPCKDSAGKFGLYDLVEGKFYGNAGTGAFLGNVKRKLPEGYTQVDYIKSSGAQYVDTGFKPNNNTGVVVDAQITELSSDNSALFGARKDSSSYMYVLLYHNSDGAFRSDYNDKPTQEWNVNATNRRTYVKNKETTVIDGVSKSYTNSIFSTPFNLFLLANNNGGKVAWKSKAKLYSCQIYDNDTLIRDYVPCINAQGTAGLYDVTNDVFYANAGSGTFATGEIVEYVENVGGGPSKPTAVTVTYTDWRVWDIPYFTEINRIRNNVNSLRGGFYNLSDWHEISYKNNPNFEDTNTLEWDMQTIYNWLKLMVLNFKYSGEVYAGEAW